MLGKICQKTDTTKCSYTNICQQATKACTFKEMLGCGTALARFRQSGHCACCGYKTEKNELFLVNEQCRACSTCAGGFILDRMKVAAGCS